MFGIADPTLPIYYTTFMGATMTIRLKGCLHRHCKVFSAKNFLSPLFNLTFGGHKKGLSVNFNFFNFLTPKRHILV